MCKVDETKGRRGRSKTKTAAETKARQQAYYIANRERDLERAIRRYHEVKATETPEEYAARLAKGRAASKRYYEKVHGTAVKKPPLSPEERRERQREHVRRYAAKKRAEVLEARRNDPLWIEKERLKAAKVAAKEAEAREKERLGQYREAHAEEIKAALRQDIRKRRKDTYRRVEALQLRAMAREMITKFESLGTPVERHRYAKELVTLSAQSGNWLLAKAVHGINWGVSEYIVTYWDEYAERFGANPL